MKLVHEVLGLPINIGDVVTTFRGEKGKLIAAYEPGHIGSTGRVAVQLENGDVGSWYPSVIRAKFIEEGK